MSAKCLDQQGRWRNKVVAFRMSPEEDELLETAVRLSGYHKEDQNRAVDLKVGCFLQQTYEFFSKSSVTFRTISLTS